MVFNESMASTSNNIKVEIDYDEDDSDSNIISNDTPTNSGNNIKNAGRKKSSQVKIVFL